MHFQSLFYTCSKSQPSSTVKRQVFVEILIKKKHKTLGEGFFFLRNNQNENTNQRVILLHWKWRIFQMPLLHDERYCEPYDMDNQSELFHYSFLWLLLSKNDACQYWQRCYQFHYSIISKSFVNSCDDKHISKNWFTAMCWLMSNNVTVTGFIFFFFFWVPGHYCHHYWYSSSPSSSNLSIFLQFGFYSSVQNASSLSFTTGIIVSYLWIVKYLFE